jgi:aspartyl-tRNA synthetase
MGHWKRTHTCGELRDTHVAQTVTINGWVNSYRAYPDQVFVDLRDRYGVTQVVFEADAADMFKIAQEVRGEFVLSVTGTVRERLPGKHNPKLATGDIEILAKKLVVLNRCPTPPFEVTEFPGSELANEDLRLQYRYLDLRRASIQRTLIMRHRLNKVIRDYLDERGFLELETPLLGRSSPEGARDYLVPSRVTPGTWYALPQSPQLYKQLLMVAGYDKYFQIARCLRDEDLRADRQPEFTQLDVEMSFVEIDDVMAVMEGLTVETFQKCLGVTIPTPLPRIKYADAMLKYGSDKPDLRFGLEIVDVEAIAAQTEFQVFKATLEAGGKVRGLCAPGGSTLTRKQIDELSEFVKRYGGKGCAWVKVEGYSASLWLKVRKCCSARTVVGTRTATCLPLSTVLKAARMASSVLP